MPLVIRRGVLRLFRIAGDVRPGETLLAGAMSANLFLLLVLYYLLKTVREPLVLVSGADWRQPGESSSGGADSVPLSVNCRRPRKCDTWIVKLERHGGASVRLITVCAGCDVGRAIAVSRSPGLGVVRNPPNAPRDVVCVSYVYMMIEPDDARHGR